MNQDQALKKFAPFENIIFDYGGIFLDLDFQKTAQAFNQLGGGVEFSTLFSKANQTPIFNLLETGKIRKAEFLAQLKKLLNLKNTPDQIIIDAWCAMLLDIRSERVEFLGELRKTKKIYLLSNINEIHEEWADEYIQKNPSFKNFYALFNHVYFSHVVGIRKPDREIFEYVCTHSNLDRKKTIFIDDSIQHIESASRFGLHTHFLDPSNTFIVGNPII